MDGMSTLLLVLSLAGSPDTEVIHCKYKTRSVGCNTVRYNLCTDGETQWEEGHQETLAYCVPTQPIDPEEWGALPVPNEEMSDDAGEFIQEELELVQ